MKKVFAFIFAILAVFFVNISFSGTVEAARVAIVPIQINIDKVERAADFNNYYWDIMVEKFPYPEYELMDDEKVSAVLPDGELKSYNQAALEDLCNKIDADIVLAMRLDDVFEESTHSRFEPAWDCNMRGEYAGYNRLTGRYYHKKIYLKDTIEEILLLKNDWQRDMFTLNLKRYIHRTVDVKAK